MRIQGIREEPDGGPRLLVDRLWPRGISKERAALDGWLKELAPSTQLRKAYHEGMTWDAFVAAYQEELADADLSVLPSDAVLVTAVSKRPNHADVLLDMAG